ncbi:CapA family protein [Streptomyces lasiicapitis]|uniref:CapA family protein n=1 Tax=Streptomyces lasiicapitis TaxID=1923961 RepID=UPI0036A050B4
MTTRPSRRLIAVCAASIALLASATAGPRCGAAGAPAAAGGPPSPGPAAGDILIHPELTEQARKDAKATGKGEKGIDFGPMMAGIKPVISKADLGICHFEPVVGTPTGPFQGFPDFIVPPQITTAVKGVGYDQCSSVSNHSLDHGPAGVTRTLDALDKAGLRHTGTARNKAEADKPLITNVKGVKVGQIAFALGFNGRQVPKDKPWLANLTDFDRIAAAEKKARAAGAEVVILSIHWGKEHQPNAAAQQVELGRRIAKETGIDLVVGHHAHVVQPMEKVDGTWIAYGLGNQIARHDKPSGLTEEGVIGWFEFHKRGGKWDVDAKYVPTFTEIPPDPDEDGAALPKDAVKNNRLLDVAAALRDGDKLTDQQRARYRLAFERTEGTLLNRGGGKDGLESLEKLPD